MACDSYNPKIQTLYRSEITVKTYYTFEAHNVEAEAQSVANSNDCEHGAKSRHPIANGEFHYTDVYFMSDIEADVKAAADEFLSWCRFRDDVFVEEC